MEKESKVPAGAKEWKEKIFAINDRKLLDYIQDMVRLRLDHDRAEENLEKSEKKVRTGEIGPSDYKPPRRKLKPIKLAPVSKESVDNEEPVY